MRKIHGLFAAIASVGLYAAPALAQIGPVKTDPLIPRSAQAAPAIQINKAAFDQYLISLGVSPAAAAAHNLTDSEVLQMRTALTGAIDAANLAIALARSLPASSRTSSDTLNQVAGGLLRAAHEQSFGELEPGLVRLDNAVMAARPDLARTAPVVLASYLERQQKILQQLSNLSRTFHDTAMSIIQKIRE